MTHEQLEEANRLGKSISEAEWLLKCLKHHDLRVDFAALGMDMTERPFAMQNIVSFLGTEDERRFISDSDRYELDRLMVKALRDNAVGLLEARLEKLKKDFADV